MTNATWLLIGAVIVLYARSHSALAAAPTAKVHSPSAEWEVDPTRWSHNGDQPTWTQNGNQSHIIDEQVASLSSAF